MKAFTEFLRRFKITYMVYNFFHRKDLMHNEILYKKLGLNKKYYSSISSTDFENVDKNLLQQNINLSSLDTSESFQKLNAASQQSLASFNENGFAVLKHFVSENDVDAINHDIENGLASGKLEFVNHNKIMFALHQYDSIYKIGNQIQLKQILDILLKGKAILFQSINFLKGSEQDTHSDSIHMTTFPLGGLLGVWVALEDIDEDNGPLHYYPGSHLLPYYLNKDYDNVGNSWMVGSKTYDEYEAFIEQKMQASGMEKVSFTCKKGDVLIWHANLFHGGNKHLNPNKTRKSMVFHYFKEGVICYHEITQRPALIK